LAQDLDDPDGQSALGSMTSRQLRTPWRRGRPQPCQQRTRRASPETGGSTTKFDLLSTLANHSAHVVEANSGARGVHGGTLNECLMGMRADNKMLEKRLISKLRTLELAHKVLRHVTAAYVTELQNDLNHQLTVLFPAKPVDRVIDNIQDEEGILFDDSPVGRSDTITMEDELEREKKMDEERQKRRDKAALRLQAAMRRRLGKRKVEKQKEALLFVRLDRLSAMMLSNDSLHTAIAEGVAEGMAAASVGRETTTADKVAAIGSTEITAAGMAAVARLHPVVDRVAAALWAGPASERWTPARVEEEAGAEDAS